MSIPKVFVSYSHDSQEHKRWVLEFATKLRHNGIDAILDQWELKRGDDIPHFMETHLANSDYVLMICTDKYVEKANSGAGGVGYEKMIITSELMKNIDSNKVIPVIRQNGTHNVPTFLKTKLYIDFSLTDNFEYNFDDLIRSIHGKPLYVKPEIGENPLTSEEASKPPEKTGDLIMKLMEYFVDIYENGADFLKPIDIHNALGISRIFADLVIDEAEKKGLIKKGTYYGTYELTTYGKQYAIENKLTK